MKATLTSLFIAVWVFFVEPAFAGYDTNICFVTLGERSSVVTPEALDNAKTNIECQPADIDSAGHWGIEINGERLSVRFDKQVFRSNDPVIATIIYRNAGSRHDSICSWAFGGDLDFTFTIIDANGTQLSDSFVLRRVDLPTAIIWVPGTQYKYQSNLTKRYGLYKPGVYTVSVHRKVRLNANQWVDLSSVDATIKIVPPT